MPIPNTLSLTPLPKQQSKHQIAIICLSSIIASFDFIIYVYLAGPISQAFFPSSNELATQLQMLSVFSAGFIARPVGALLLGSYGDINGRKPALTISLCALTIATLLTVALPTYEQIGITATLLFVGARLLQGMAFGAMVPLGWVFVAEYVDRRSLASYCGLVSASLVLGNLIVLLFFRVLDSVLSHADNIAYGWRIPFVFGGVISLVALLLCRQITETPSFLAYKETLEQDLKVQSSFYLNLIPQFSRPYNLMLIAVLSFIVASLVMVVVLLLPDLISLKFAIDQSLLTFANIMGLLFLVLGCLFFGTIGDRVGVARALIIGAVALILQTILLYSRLITGNGDYILVLYALLGFCCGIMGLCATLIVQIFPISVRVLGVSLIYNAIFALAGALLPFGLFYATELVAIAPALYLIFIGIIAVIVGIHLSNKTFYKEVTHSNETF